MKSNQIFFILFLQLLSLSLFSNQLIGYASWYGPNFHGKRTANGEIFNTYDLTAAHKTLPFDTIVKVISLENKNEVIVRINDRGPFAKGRIIDLSKKAASRLDLIKQGTMKVKLIVLKQGNGSYKKRKKNYAKKFIIQLASFNQVNKALSLKDRFHEKSIPVLIKKVTIKNNNFYRVITPVLSYQEMQKYQIKIHELGVKNYLIKSIQ